MAAPLHSVVCFALGTEQRMAVGDSHDHIVPCRRSASCIVNLNLKQHLSVKRNSRSYSYVVVFPTKKVRPCRLKKPHRALEVRMCPCQTKYCAQ